MLSKYSNGNRSDEYWALVATREFEAMDEDERAQWAELRPRK